MGKMKSGAYNAVILSVTNIKNAERFWNLIFSPGDGDTFLSTEIKAVILTFPNFPKWHMPIP